MPPRTLAVSPSSSLACPPRWGTQRSPHRETHGDRLARVAEMLGQPLMPWQRHVADVGLEVDPDTGLLAYRSVVVLLPRQNGKTTLVLAWELERALLWGSPQKIAYTAQTGMDARKKLLDDQVPLLERSPLKAAVTKVHRAQGAESVQFATGSRIDVLASTESAGHGKTLDLGVRDELFSDTDDRRQQAMGPAMVTRRNAQMLTPSTMGTDSSVPLNREVDQGRALVEAGRTDGTAYFEWSAPPEAPIDDPATWRACMPALGFTITEAVVRHNLETMEESEFRRAFLNQRTRSDERVIPVGAWDAVCLDHVTPDGALRFAVDVNQHRSAAAIAVCDSQGRAELVEHGGGVSWVLERLLSLHKRYGAPVGLDATGPASSLVPDLEAAGVQVEAMMPRQVAQACGQLFDAVAEGTVAIRRSPVLDDAAAAARKRVAGDSWSWSRTAATADICPLVALTIAHSMARQTSEPALWAY